jgi:hypothetical protein
MNGGLSQHARVAHHVDRDFRDRLEGFNRASHGDALRELQLPPAETLQIDHDRRPPTPREVLAAAGWRRIAIAAVFAIVTWLGTAAFAVMCSAPVQ